jgi:hypothetical protein
LLPFFGRLLYEVFQVISSRKLGTTKVQLGAYRPLVRTVRKTKLPFFKKIKKS